MPGQHFQPPAPSQDPTRVVQASLRVVSVVLLRGDRRLVTGEGGQQEVGPQGGGQSDLATEGLQQDRVQAVRQCQGR